VKLWLLISADQLIRKLQKRKKTTKSLCSLNNNHKCMIYNLMDIKKIFLVIIKTKKYISVYTLFILNLDPSKTELGFRTLESI
jgi:hypothetical protein